MIVVNSNKCTGCGLCLKVCPSEILAVEHGKVVVTAQGCIDCGHCSAICPEGALQEQSGGWADEYEYVDFEPRVLQPGNFDTAALARLMRSRRSCRRYKPAPVPRSLLNDLIRMAESAPSGTNSRKRTYTVLPDRESVMKLGDRIAEFFVDLNKAAEKPLLRYFLKCFGKKELDDYYKGYYSTVKRALQEWESGGRDRLFHHAPAAVVVSSRPGGSTPAEDALLAVQNLLLGAHALGLGTCIIGYASAAMQNDAYVQRVVDIPSEEIVHAVVVMGYPDVQYADVTRPEEPPVRCFEPPE